MFNPCSTCASVLADALAPAPKPRFLSRWHRFGSDQNGTIAVFSLFVFLAMILVAGLAIDLARHENERVRMQGTADRAVLAAAQANETGSGETPEQIARAYFAADNLSPQLGNQIRVTIAEDGGRTVRVVPGARIPSLFGQLLGIDSLDMVTPSEASEVMGNEGGVDVELVMVLDTSGSMNGSGKIAAMRGAANDLITQLLTDSTSSDVAISLVPYHTDVLPPTGFLNQFTNVSGSGACNTWANWSTLSNTPSLATMRRNCSTNVWRTMRPFLNDPVQAQAHINALRARGGTSTDVGMRWGAAMFDNDMAPIISNAISTGMINSAFEGRPYAWNTPNVMRALIFLTDGQNNYAVSDQNTIETCTALKANGVTIYTVAFQAPTSGEQLLQACASSASHHYNADVSSIATAFQGIAGTIQAQALRLTL